MKKLTILTIFLSITFALFSQNMDISFQPEDESATIDSVLAINLNTGQKVKLSGNENLVLIMTPTGGVPLRETQKTGILYPNPTREEANLVFSTDRNQTVELRIYNFSGQLLTTQVQSLPRGTHRFLLKFPTAGVFDVSIVTSEADQSFKVVYTGLAHSFAHIQYAGIEEQNSILEINRLKSSTILSSMLIAQVQQPLPVGVPLNYSEGDIIQYTVFSGVNTTILTGSPTESKTYVVPFYECTDKDNNSYKVVKIGEQTWMAENLKSTKYRNGAPIPNVTSDMEWGGLTTGAYCNYNNDETIASTYGRLYNWYAVNDSRNIAPVGWHVASDAEWTTLTDFLGGEGVAGDKLRETGTTHWVANPDTYATNETGFTVLPGGCRQGGIFNSITFSAYWWTSSESGNPGYAWYRCASQLSHSVYRTDSYWKEGFSVRCVKDSETPTGSLPPEADFMASKTNVSKGESIEFTDKSTNSPTSWLWDFGDGSTSTEQSPSKIFNTAGTFTISLKATNRNGDDTKTITNYITVNESIDGEETVTDIDGNVYHTVVIGTQVWMVENLKTTKYRNGDPIPNVTGDTEWIGLTTGAYCNNNNDENIAATYGRLYNWYAVNDSRNIAPEGWHVASKAEWTNLTDFLGGDEVAGDKLKESGTTHWDTPNSGATNETGFTALPGGARNSVPGVSSTFWFDGKWGYWWSSHSVDEEWANMWYMTHEVSSCSRGISYKYCGYSVRCIKDH